MTSADLDALRQQFNESTLQPYVMSINWRHDQRNMASDRRLSALQSEQSWPRLLNAAVLRAPALAALWCSGSYNSTTHLVRLGEAKEWATNGCHDLAETRRTHGYRPHSSPGTDGIYRSVSCRNGGVPQRRKPSQQQTRQSQVGLTQEQYCRFSDAWNEEESSAPSSWRDASTGAPDRRSSRCHTPHRKWTRRQGEACKIVRGVAHIDRKNHSRYAAQ